MGLMSQQEIPYWFPFIFLGLWLAMNGLMAVLSGWSRLAEQFRAKHQPSGERFTRQIVSVGFVRENGATNLIVSVEGLFLSSFILFRFLRPPVLIPWRFIRVARQKKILWLQRYVLDLASVTTITVKRTAYQAIEQYVQSPRTLNER